VEPYYELHLKHTTRLFVSHQRSLTEILESVSDILFPEELGERIVDVNDHGYDGDTPLHALVTWQDVEGARLLIAAGADVNAVGEMSETPLHGALSNQDLPMIRLLIEANARTDMRSKFGETQRERAERLGIVL
jgi:ankyrin repeat protein